MFRKIVTELAYSPALAGNLGDYIKKLRDERSKRQIGIIFVLLAIVVQLFATLFPPESANANNPDVLIDGGVQSVDDYLTYYDQNAENIRDLLTSLGITRSDIEAARLATLPSTAEASFWSVQNNRGEDGSSYSFQTPSGKLGVAYYRPLSSLHSLPEAYVGSSAQSGEWFAVTKNSGNLITEAKSTPNCSSWFSTSVGLRSTSSWNDAVSCPAALEPSLSARTILPSSSTTPRMANASDRIAYTLSITNKGVDDMPVVPAINLEDVLEYSRILDNGGGEYNYDTKMLSWSTTTLAAGESAERNFIIQLLPTVPSTARGQHIDASYDCMLKASFGNSISTSVNCPFVKHIENVTNNLPMVSKRANLISAAGLLIATLYLYFRSRQLLTELYIIRHNHLGGL